MGQIAWMSQLPLNPYCLIYEVTRMTKKESRYPDIKPYTPVFAFDAGRYQDDARRYSMEVVSPVTGMQSAFIAKVIGRKGLLSDADVSLLLQQDAFSETFIPRSKVHEYLASKRRPPAIPESVEYVGEHCLLKGNAVDLIRKLDDESVNCVVTSTPYWGTRIYETAVTVEWADGEACAYGHEQTPEGFIRHSVELIYELSRKVTADGSIWWNLMDTFNTRTQIRSNAAEALRAMQGKDANSWHDHECRRYSAGHSFLKDGELCFIPQRIAERASRLGLWTKSIITWAKTGSMPEPQNSRVSRNLEYVLHLARQRTPKFDKEAFRTTVPTLGGRNPSLESDRLSDVWQLPTSSGRDGHGAQFPLALPGRCIAVSTVPGDVVLDPFCGSGTTGIAASLLERRFIGFDVSHKYIQLAKRRMEAASIKQAAMELGT